jgi:hypothetical protein
VKGFGNHDSAVFWSAGIKPKWSAMSAIDPKLTEAIQSRMQSIREWMADEAPYVSADQKHLGQHTPERAYWHYGYQAALKDILDLAGRCSSPATGNEDRST